MGCLVFLLALLLPRVAMVLIFLFTQWFSAVFETWLLPLLGFIFLPYTTLAYMGAMLNAGEVTLGWLILIILAVLADVAHWGGGYRTHRRRVVVVKEKP
jgi:hypothetical protein